MDETDLIDAEEPGKFHTSTWLSWLLGIALLSALFVVVFHFSEEREFLALAQQAEPKWILVALILQAATYLAQGEIWRIFGRLAGVPLSIWTVYKISLAKIFIDQALPSSGVSGTIIAAKALEERGLPRPAVVTSVLVSTASFCASYVICLLAMLILQGKSGNHTVADISMVFIIIGTAITILILWLAGKKVPENISRRFRFLRKIFGFLEHGDPELAHNKRLMFIATALQVLILLLDTATLWVLIKSVGVNAPVIGVFASFMFASLIRSAGIVPGGLGTFEAAAVWTLKMAGVSVGVSLAATLLFRGVSFWLPMIPGFWLSHRVVSKSPRQKEEATFP